MTAAPRDSVAHARGHYDRDLTDRFYHRVWAEDDLFIGIGLFRDPEDSLQTACRRAIDALVARMPRPAEGSRLSILDLGGGYGAADRHLTSALPCSVTVVNLSAVQNRQNRARNAAAGLAEAITVVDGDFQALPPGLGTFDVVMSQDAFVHADDRAAVFAEIDRVLRPGGQVLFTDLTCDLQAPPDALGPVLDRLGLTALGTPEAYVALAESHGWTVRAVDDLSPHVATHYRRLLATLTERRADLADAFTDDDLTAIAAGIQVWIAAAEQGHLGWTSFHFGKPAGPA